MFFFSVAISVMVILCILAVLPRPKPPVQNYINLTPYELLERQTYLAALQGNKAARDWTMEHTLRGKNQSASVDIEEPSCYTKKEESTYCTAPKEVQDAIGALVSLGHTRANAQISVNKLIKDKSFKTSQQIIMEAMKRKS